MGLAERHQESLKRTRQLRSVEFGYSGDTYRGIRAKMSSEFTRGDYGFTTGYLFSIRAIVSELPRIPKSGERITVGDVRHRILDPVEIDSYDVSVLLHLGPEAK